jgi:pimeloyl-ACP methyl ester carboxylesterase
MSAYTSREYEPPLRNSWQFVFPKAAGLLNSDRQAVGGFHQEANSFKEPPDEPLSNNAMIPRANFSTLLTVALIALASCDASHGNTANSDYLTIGGDKLYYETSGNGAPLVLVSGGSGMDLRQWDLVVPTLDDNYRVIRYDPRGVGRSDNPSVRYSDTADLAALLDHLDLDRVGLIGLSSAGGFVLEFASLYPERVSGVVAAAPFIPGFEFSQEMLTRLDVFNNAAQEGREPFLDAMLGDPHFIPAPLDASVRSAARINMAENFDKGSGFDPTLPIPIDPPLIERLSGIKSTVLLLAGELDHSEVLRRNSFLEKEIPRASVKVIEKAGHNAPLENPEAFLGAAAPFLQQITN